MDQVTLILSRNDVGQLLDGLGVLIEQWDATAEYLATGLLRDDVCIREAHDMDEARSIAATYRALEGKILGQLPAQHPR